MDFATIQLTLSLYLAAIAIGQLIVGPLSDQFGRRPVLLIGLIAFVTGSLICLIAPNIVVLIFGRVIQALGGCVGITLCRAIVRDLYGRNEVASMIGYVTMGMAVAPMVAPTIGGVLATFFGWRASFGFLMIAGPTSRHPEARAGKAAQISPLGHRPITVTRRLRGAEVSRTVGVVRQQGGR